MSIPSTPGARPCRVLLCLLIPLLPLAGCDEETVGPESRGRISGHVQDASTDDPIERASVSTSPPTESILTDDDGSFLLEGVQTGNYTVEVSKTDYQSRSVTVKVEENRTATARVLLERSEDADSQTDSLHAEVTNWYNDRVNRDSTGADSLFADVEYTVRNVGTVPVRRYEVYFRIGTPAGDFSFEVQGDSLDVGQQDVGGFRRHILEEAETVEVRDLYYEPKDDA
jgi:hypothetical protein